MKQKLAREIIAAIPSLYNLKGHESEAINTLLEPKELVTNDDSKYGHANCPSCDIGLHYYSARFCWKCGQPLDND